MRAADNQPEIIEASEPHLGTIEAEPPMLERLWKLYHQQPTPRPAESSRTMHERRISYARSRGLNARAGAWE